MKSTIKIGTNVVYQNRRCAVVERVRSKTKPRSKVANTRHTTSEVSFVVRMFDSKGDEGQYWVTPGELSPDRPIQAKPVQAKPVVVSASQRCRFKGKEFDILDRIRVKERIHGELEKLPGLELKSMPIATFVIRSGNDIRRVACTDVQLILPGKPKASASTSKQSRLPGFVKPGVNVIGVPGYAREKIGRIEDVKPVIKPLPEVFKGDYSSLLRHLRKDQN